MRKGIRGLGGGKQGRECNGRLHLQGARYASLRSVRAVPAAEVSVRTGGYGRLLHLVVHELQVVQGEQRRHHLPPPAKSIAFAVRFVLRAALHAFDFAPQCHVLSHVIARTPPALGPLNPSTLPEKGRGIDAHFAQSFEEELEKEQRTHGSK